MQSSSEYTFNPNDDSYHRLDHVTNAERVIMDKQTVQTLSYGVETDLEAAQYSPGEADDMFAHSDTIIPEVIKGRSGSAYKLDYNVYARLSPDDLDDYHGKRSYIEIDIGITSTIENLLGSYSFTFDVSEILQSAVLLINKRYTSNYYQSRALVYFVGIIPAILPQNPRITVNIKMENAKRPSDVDSMSMNSRFSIRQESLHLNPEILPTTMITGEFYPGELDETSDAESSLSSFEEVENPK